MDMDFMDPFRRPYTGMGLPAFAGQQHARPQAHQYTQYWSSPLASYYQQQQRAAAAAAMMGQGNLVGSKQTEPKPRLAKDEVELLEREFSKNPKPNSSTKRELAERMGVEVPRINNWFQNRRAKEKQMRKTAEYEAQQARGRTASGESSKSPSEDPEQSAEDEFYGAGSHQPLISTAMFGRDEDETAESEDSGPRPLRGEAIVPALEAAVRSTETPASTDSDGYVHVDYESSSSPPHHFQAPTPSELAPPASISPDSFGPARNQTEFQRQAPFPFGHSETPRADGNVGAVYDSLSAHGGMMGDSSGFHSFPERDYFAAPPVPRFPSEMLAGVSNGALAHRVSADNLVKLENMSPSSAADSPSPVSDLRFKSPPPPADIAGRRKMRRPTPLGLTSLRGPPGPKTSIDAPRRSDTVSPMRRMSSATGLSGRVQKSFVCSGPRSPFAMDRNKEALLQSIHGTQSPIIGSLNSAMSPMSPEMVGGQGARENAMGASGADEDQGFFGSLGAVGGLPVYNKVEPPIKTPPGTPGLAMGFQETYFPTSMEHPWNFVPQDEPLPTPSLCSHGGSELDFSMAQQMPGYVASQPVTPSFPPSIGPAYNGFFGHSVTNAEYHFPDSYPPESSARSSPAQPPKSKQFQFAQNVTPQSFTEK